MRVIVRYRDGSKQLYEMNPVDLTLDECLSFVRANVPNAATILIRVK